MNKKIGIIFLALFFLCSCFQKKNETDVRMLEKNTNDLNIDNISFIKVLREGIEYEIRDKNEISTLVNTIKNSHIEYIKFGSKNTMSAYDLNGNKIFEAFFRENIFKVNGVVYKSEKKWF